MYLDPGSAGLFVQALFAVALFEFSVRTFDRRLGRTPEVAGRAESKRAKLESIPE